MAATEQTNGDAHLFTATYHDTPDGRLARAGIWEAKIAGTVVAVSGGPAGVPDELARRLQAPLRQGELVEVARLRNGGNDVALLEGQRVVRTFPDLDTAVRKTVEVGEGPDD